MKDWIELKTITMKRKYAQLTSDLHVIIEI